MRYNYFMSNSSIALMPAIIIVKKKHSQVLIVEKPGPKPILLKVQTLTLLLGAAIGPIIMCL